MLLQVVLVALIWYVPLGTSQPQVGPAGKPCITPQPTPITELKDAGIKGRYPRTEIWKATRASALYKSAAASARLSVNDCYRPRQRMPKLNDTDTDTKSFSAAHHNSIIDTCPAVYRTYTIPNSVWYNNQRCWVLRPWAGLRCPYRRCRSFGRCNGVSARTGIDVCRHSSWRYKRYFIWCPRNNGIYVRYFRLPYCCSCMVFRCFWA